MDEITTKICTGCGEEKSLDSFYKAKGRKFGRASWCKDCCKKYREANKEKIKEQQKVYYQTNKKEIKEKVKEYREANKEKIAEYQKEYREANKEKKAKRDKEYREANKEKIAKYLEINKDRRSAHKKAYNKANRAKLAESERRWKQANKDKVNESNMRRYALKKACAVEKIDYLTIRERDHVCYLCSVPFTEEERFNTSLTQIDHKIPLTRSELNPTHSYENCALTHKECNLNKSDKTPEEYWAWLDAMPAT